MNTKHTIRRWIDIIEQNQSCLIYEGKLDRKPIPKVADVLRSEKPDMKTLAEITVKYIEENCQPWLQSTKKDQVVYRSIHKPWNQTEDDVVFTRVVRTNRRPTDSSSGLHRLFNEMIKLAGGTANRSNSAFVTGSYRHASGYDGSVHVVMPVGNFHYTWSPYYRDWYGVFEEDEIHDDKYIDLVFSKQKFKQEVDVDTEFKKHKQEWGWHASDKKDYIADEFREWYREKTRKGDASALDQNNLKKLIKADTGLPQAIESKNEIMISASSVLYIEWEFYKKYIEPIYTFG